MSTSSQNLPDGNSTINWRYKCGQPMPAYVTDALRFIGKVGVVTRRTWNEYFCPGSDRWKRAQLQHMIARGLFEPHTCKNLAGTWVLTDWSAKLLRGQGFSSVNPVPAHLIEHDEVVGAALWKLKRDNLCKDWLSERELKERKLHTFLLEKKENDPKYPDAVFRLAGNAKLYVVALEYERTGKSTFRYRSILRHYSKLRAADLVLYVAEEDVIKRRIVNALKYMGDKDLIARIGFIKGYEWKSDPGTAPILRSTGTTCLKEILSNMS